MFRKKDPRSKFYTFAAFEQNKSKPLRKRLTLIWILVKSSHINSEEVEEAEQQN